MGTKLAVRRLEKRVRKIKKPTILLLESATLFTPQPVSELDAAATKVQKVYKSYRTRRDLADCAALVQKLWWQTLDFAALKRSSVSFYNIEKHDSADRSGHGLGQGLPIGKGLCEDEKAQKLAPQHWLEAIDPLHRYGHNLHCYHDVWSNWLDVGDSKYTNLTSAQEVLVYNFSAFSILDQKRGRHTK